jgi:hypothetical protein
MLDAVGAVRLVVAQLAANVLVVQAGVQNAHRAGMRRAQATLADHSRPESCQKAVAAQKVWPNAGQRAASASHWQ